MNSKIVVKLKEFSSDILNFEFNEYDLFVRKNFFSKFQLFSYSFSRCTFSKVYKSLETINTWSEQLSFLLNCEILQGFVFFNLNRLKNIFLKVISDYRIWKEIDKMFCSNFISFSKNYLYKNKSNINLNCLSLLLFNIYLSELDFYVIFRVFFILLLLEITICFCLYFIISNIQILLFIFYS